jgi:hypothetical protein
MASLLHEVESGHDCQNFIPFMLRTLSKAVPPEGLLSYVHSGAATRLGFHWSSSTIGARNLAGHRPGLD